MKGYPKNLALAVALLSLTTYCGNDDSTSAPTLSVPDLRPTVQAALSSTLISGGRYAQALEAEPAANTSAVQAEASACNADCYVDGQSNQLKLACEARNRFFCQGPTEILYLINLVDSTLAEVEARSTGTVACMSESLVDSTSELSFPGTQTLPHSLQCKDSSIATAWGQDAANNTWYVRGANGAIGFVASIEDEDEVEGYFWLPSKDYSFSESTGLVSLQASKNSKTYEMTGGGTGLGFCGFHMKTNETHIYIYGNISTPGNPENCDHNGSGKGNNDWYEACLNSDFTFSDGGTGADVSACSAIDKNDFALKTLYRAQTLNASSANQTGVTGDDLTIGAPPASTEQGNASFDIGKGLNDLFTSAGNLSSSVAEFTVTD